MIAARTIQGDNLTEEDMVIYYKNPRGNWINATNGAPIPHDELPQSFTITHTDLEGEVVVDKTVLENFISTAINNRVSTSISTNGSDVDPLAKWVTQAVMDAYTDAIEAAQTVADKEDATQAEVHSVYVVTSSSLLQAVKPAVTNRAIANPIIVFIFFIIIIINLYINALRLFVFIRLAGICLRPFLLFGACKDISSPFSTLINVLRDIPARSATCSEDKSRRKRANFIFSPKVFNVLC